MLEKVKYIYYLKEFSKKVNLIIKKIESNKDELNDQDRETIKILTEAFLKTEKN